MRSYLFLAALGLPVLVSAPSSAAAKLGETCDGIAAIQCEEGLWCEHPGGECMTADGAGTCAKAPEVCTEQYEPVCGCDGKTYSNDCHRKAAKAQLDYAGECKKK